MGLTVDSSGDKRRCGNFKSSIFSNHFENAYWKLEFHEERRKQTKGSLMTKSNKNQAPPHNFDPSISHSEEVCMDMNQNEISTFSRSDKLNFYGFHCISEEAALYEHPTTKNTSSCARDENMGKNHLAVGGHYIC